MIGPIVFSAVCIVIGSCHNNMIDNYSHILSSIDWCNMIGSFVSLILCMSLCKIVWCCHRIYTCMNPSMDIHLDLDTAPPGGQFLHTQCCILKLCNFYSHLCNRVIKSKFYYELQKYVGSEFR